MEHKFVKAFATIAIVVSTIAGIVLAALGIAILFFPEAFLQILIYVIGGALLIAGLVILFSVLRALLTTKAK